MQLSMLYSDMAIIIYEILGILILIFMIRRFSRIKKEIKMKESEWQRKSRERSLERQLYNERRR